MPGGILPTIRNYLEWADTLGQEYRSSRLVLFLQLLAFRAVARLGPPWFDAYGIHASGFHACRDFVSFEESRAALRKTAPPRFRHLEESKVTFAALCAERGIPCVEVAAFIAFEDTALPERAARTLRSARDLERYFEETSDMDAIVKPNGGGQGYGLWAMVVTDGKLLPSPDYRTCQEFLDFLAAQPTLDGGAIIQRRVAGHRSMAELFPGPGLGTVRINTFLMRDGSVEIPWAILKVPGPGSLFDNWRLGTGGGLMCPVDPATGTVGPGLGRDAPRGPLRQYATHPLTGAAVQGRILPHWDQVEAMVREGAQRIPELPALGWDVVITDAGPLVLEANWQWTIVGYQVLFRRGLRREFEDLLGHLAAPQSYAAGRE